MPKPLKCFSRALTNIPTEYQIALGYLTYHSGKLFNQAYKGAKKMAKRKT